MNNSQIPLPEEVKEFVESLRLCLNSFDGWQADPEDWTKDLTVLFKKALSQAFTAGQQEERKKIKKLAVETRKIKQNCDDAHPSAAIYHPEGHETTLYIIPESALTPKENI